MQIYVLFIYLLTYLTDSAPSISAHVWRECMHGQGLLYKFHLMYNIIIMHFVQ